MGSSNSEVIVAVVALVISVIALSATFMQVLQQYYASAQGYSLCNEKVMGEWAKTKSRRFLWDELRFEVEFDSPVIFVSPPKNERGPVSMLPIHFLDGTSKSLADTWSVNVMDERKEYENRTVKERIHTADNERASWFILMYAVQRMEGDSAIWQKKQYENIGPPSDPLSSRYSVPQAPPTLQDAHTFTVAVQRKRKSWDTMPAAITKPYATTTMCHLVEMMAALGVYWKEFNRTHDRYRAEGNGFMVLGERVSDPGLVFSFHIYGKCQFERNRVIPVDEVKELCFGYVPTIYRETLDQRRIGSREDEPLQLRTLSMAGQREIAETLVLIGCNNNSVRCFLDDGKRTSHLFPMSFEILGMLSRTFHIDNSSFTYIPNPTPDRWDRRSMSLVKIMMSYQEFVKDDLPDVRRNAIVLRRIQSHLAIILQYQNESKPAHMLLGLKALHLALDDMDEILTAKSKADRTADAGRPSVQQEDHKESVDSPQVVRQELRREAVQDVLRSHIQEVLRLLNERDDRGDPRSLQVPTDMSPSTPTGSRFQDQPRPPRPPRFEDMDSASPDDRQEKFMEVYFGVIRSNVVPHAAHNTVRRNSTDRRASVAAAPPGFGFARQGTGRTNRTNRTNATARAEEGSPRTSAVAVNSIKSGTAIPNIPLQELTITTDELPPSGPGSVAVVDDDETAEEEPTSLADLEVTHDDIWCTLVFRMLCWLMLHDFDKVDVQINKSELMGSRMPVYIA